MSLNVNNRYKEGWGRVIQARIGVHIFLSYLLSYQLDMTLLCRLQHDTYHSVWRWILVLGDEEEKSFECFRFWGEDISYVL